VSVPTLLEARNLVQEFRFAGGIVRALSNVSLTVRTGEVLGVVGESGSGKSTLARSLLQIPPPKSGTVLFRDADLTQLRGRRLLEQRRHMQMIFQDPFGSLNPAWRVVDIVGEPLRGYNVGTRALRQRKVAEVLELVGLPLERYGRRRPRELSGGQCQRIAIGRALTLDPALIVCDEAVSSLDVLIQAQIMNLFDRLRTELGLSYVFISHDLALVKQSSDRVAVLHLGQLCEIAPAESLYRHPRHPYTASLLRSIPGVRPRERRIGRADRVTFSEPPSAIDPQTGCRFRTSCPHAKEKCASEEPRLQRAGDDHFVACHFPLAAGDHAPAPAA
jgi:oligopeptide/dipeptide ABC transporter ATP-binding protein